MRQPSHISTNSESIEEAENWVTSVPKAIVESLSKKEVQRQSLIFELISGEQTYLNDLEVVQNVSHKYLNPGKLLPYRFRIRALPNLYGAPYHR